MALLCIKLVALPLSVQMCMKAATVEGLASSTENNM